MSKHADCGCDGMRDEFDPTPCDADGAHAARVDRCSRVSGRASAESTRRGCAEFWRGYEAEEASDEGYDPPDETERSERAEAWSLNPWTGRAR